MLHLDDRLWILWAIWLLLLPLNWLAAAVAAACIHELGHAAVLILLGGRVRQLYVTPFGMVMEAEGVGEFQEALCALAGPCSSFLLMVFLRRFPMLALCGLVQGVFNLLPVYPMDGGRVLARFLEAVIPARAEAVIRFAEKTIFFLLLAGTTALSIVLKLGFSPIFFCLFMITSALFRKRP